MARKLKKQSSAPRRTAWALFFFVQERANFNWTDWLTIGWRCEVVDRCLGLCRQLSHDQRDASLALTWAHRYTGVKLHLLQGVCAVFYGCGDFFCSHIFTATNYCSVRCTINTHPLFSFSNFNITCNPTSFHHSKTGTHATPYIEFRPSKKRRCFLGIGVLLIDEIIGTPCRRLL